MRIPWLFRNVVKSLQILSSIGVCGLALLSEWCQIAPCTPSHPKGATHCYKVKVLSLPHANIGTFFMGLLLVMVRRRIDIIYRVAQKMAQFFSYALTSSNINRFSNSFTFRIRRKLVIILSIKIPPHRCVATLPCEMSSILKAIKKPVPIFGPPCIYGLTSNCVPTHQLPYLNKPRPRTSTIR